MSKGKKPTSTINKGAKGRKNHGPKRHLHHSIGPKATRVMMARTGILSKWNNYESWQLACTARGSHNTTYSEFQYFISLSMDKKREYFTNLKKGKR